MIDNDRVEKNIWALKVETTLVKKIVSQKGGRQRFLDSEGYLFGVFG